MDRFVALFLGLVIAFGGYAQAQQLQALERSMVGASPRERVEAFLRAMGTGDVAAFEQAARENLAAEAYGRRTPQERAQIVQRVTNDFGRIQIISITVTGNQARAEIRGETGLDGAFVFAFDDAPEHRITGVNIEAGGPRPEPSAGAPNVPPAPVRPDMSAADMRAAINGWIGPFVDHDDFAGVILVAHEGRAFTTLTYGLADRERAATANADTAFNIASLGKRFTQAAVARLIQEGRLSLNTSIGDVIPDYPNVEGRIATVEQLIDMSGGIADINTPERQSEPRERFASNHDFYLYASSLPQRFTPGSRNEYCNGCYIVLGEIVERLSGMRFEDYVQRTIFGPAGMRRTGYFRVDRLPPNTAVAYRRSAGPGSDYAEATNEEGLAGSGAGGLYSTVGDLLAFDNALREGRLLDSEMSAWVLGGSEMTGRTTTLLDIKGGGPGATGSYTSNGRWSVFVLANVDPPLPIQIADAIARPLLRAP